jgi:insulin-like growth factor-binding protein complex acid labile subunit
MQSNKIKVIQDKLLDNKNDLTILYLYQNSIDSIETISFNTLRSLKKLHLFSNKIKTIKFWNFIHLQSVNELKLDKNEIVSFDANTFVGMESLKLLDLSANKIKKLVNRAFDGLKNVSKLELDLNDIEQIEMNAFTDVVNLNRLNLDSNQIFTLKNVQFNTNIMELFIQFNFISNFSEINASTLKSLHISNNRIQEINYATHLQRLEFLDLSQNRLISINEKSFSNLNGLKYLNLSGNRLDLESEFDNISYFKNQTILETLDLSFNLIKFFNTNKTFHFLSSLKCLNLSNNKLRSIKPFIFGFLEELYNLNLASNNLSLLNQSCFCNLNKLQILKLSFNQLNSLRFLEQNKNQTKSLTTLELDNNRIDFIGENDFEYNQNLIYLNLNSNPLKSINKNAFAKIKFLTTLKLSNTSISVLYVNRSVKELDLSYLSNGSFVNIVSFSKIEWINLANTKINISFDLFLSNVTRYADFSFNSFTWIEFKMFDVLGSSLETLKLRETNLQNIEQINLTNLINLKYLDLSFNNLSSFSQNSIEFLANLEYLDLSSNRISEFHIVLNKLKHLNLDNNQIFSITEIFFDYNSIETFKMANNRLQMYPSFETREIDSQNVETFIEIDLNQNQLNQIKYFSFIFGKLKFANFDLNNISSIESNAFLNCRSLEYLSIAYNRLKKIEENNFHFLFSLIHLNLSFNQIEFIENFSFKNLNKLKSLNLNYNRLISIQNDLFVGLANLRDLFLTSNENNETIFYKQSFRHLPNISTIYMNESLIVKYKCLFMHELERGIQRNISNKYIFFKSINIISENFWFNTESLKSKCNLVFHLFQFKINLNLKTDTENDLFFDSCSLILIERENNFNHGLRKCFQTFEFKDNQDFENVEYVTPFLLILSNFYFLLIMALLLCLLGPVFGLIFRYELCSKCILFVCKNSETCNEKILQELKLQIDKKEKILKKQIIEYQNSYKANIVRKNLIQKYEIDLLNLKKKLEFNSHSLARC